MADWGGEGSVPPIGNMGAPPIPKVRRTIGHDTDDDPFANFSYTPSKSSGRLRGFSRRSKYQNMASLSASRERLGSITSLGSNSNLSLFGSSQALNMNPSNMMNMQEDAKSRKISAEIMKHRLYESVITSPRRRRLSVRGDYMASSADESMIQGFYNSARYIQSMPVTPAHSQNVTPSHSPTSLRKFHYGYYSRGATPDAETKALSEETEEYGDNWKGLASLFKPQPRCIPAHNDPEPMDIGDHDNDIENLPVGFGAPPGFPVLPQREPMASGGLVLQEIRRPEPRKHQQQPHLANEISPQDLNAIAPTTF